MGRGWDKFEKLKDILSAEYILEEMAMYLSDVKLQEVVESIAKDVDIDLDD